MVNVITDGQEILVELGIQYPLGVTDGQLFVGEITYTLHPEKVIDLRHSEPGQVNKVLHIDLGGAPYAQVISVCLDPSIHQGRTFEKLIGPAILPREEAF